jgi:hypothetical protein
LRSIRFDFTKGINNVLDPRILGKGYAVVVDNADVSGFALKSYRAPVFRNEVPTGTINVFEYRGKWYYASNHRDWTAEFVGNQERVYYKEKGNVSTILGGYEEGAHHIERVTSKPPMKIVDGVEAQLGTIRPITTLKVEDTVSVVPKGVTVTALDGVGSLPEGSATYRVGFRTADGLLPTSAPITIATAANSGALVQWGSTRIDGVTKIVIYGRESGNEQILEELNPNSTEFRDDGSLGPFGQYASELDGEDLYYYFYTFQRTVGGHLDESGPSPIFGPLQTSNARQITRFYRFEGGFTGGITIDEAVVTKTVTDLEIVGYLNRQAGGKTVFTTATSHGLSSGDQIGIITKHTGIDSATKDHVYTVTAYSEALATPVITSVTEVSDIDPDRSWTVGTVLNIKVTAFRGAGWGITEAQEDILENVGSPIQGGSPAETSPSTVSTLTCAGGTWPIVKWTCDTKADGFHVYINDKWVQTISGEVFYANLIKSASTPDATRPIPDGDYTNDLAFSITTDSGLIFDDELAGESPEGYGSIATTIETKLTLQDHGLEKDDLISIESGYVELSGLYQVSRLDEMNPDDFYLEVLTESDDATAGKQILIAGSQFDHVNKWSIYVARGSSGGVFLLQGTYPITQTEVTDSKPVSALGASCPSYYTTSTAGGDSIVEFSPPPASLEKITTHNSGLWGIDGNRVCWTPINRPDAWTFYRDFPSRPLNLISYAGALIVFCTDGVWRFDGFDPANVTCSKTLARDGCIAPYSVQNTAAGIVYLAERGLMAFRAETNNSVPISDGRVEPSIFSAYSTSGADEVWPVWWIPTRQCSFWAKLTNGLPTATSDLVERSMSDVLPQRSVLEDIRSFYWRGKYYLYFIGDYFGRHGTITVDCTKEGYPISTLGLRPIASHVTDRGKAYLLMVQPVAPSYSISVTPEFCYNDADLEFNVSITRSDGYEDAITLTLPSMPIPIEGEVTYTVNGVEVQNEDLDEGFYYVLESAPDDFTISLHNMNVSPYWNGVYIQGSDGIISNLFYVFVAP